MSDEMHRYATASPVESSGSATRLFFVATYDDHSVAIKRNPDYEETIASVRRAFPALATLSLASCVRLSARFSEFPDLLVEINRELWKELLPSLTIVQVSAKGNLLSGHNNVGVTQMETAATNAQDELGVHSGPITVYISDLRANINTLALPLFSTTTICHLKDVIREHDDRLPQFLTLTYENFSNLEDHKQLHHYNIGDNSLVTITTEFMVYIIGINLPRIPITVTTFTTVRFLKVLAFALMDEDSKKRLPPYIQILMCSGDTLDDSRKLGSYRQIVPGCEIRINRGIRLRQHTTDYGLVDLCVHKHTPSNQVEDIQYKVLSGSTAMDVKLLIANTTNIPKRSQTLQSSSHELLYDSNIIKSPSRNGTIIIHLTTSNQGNVEVQGRDAE